VCVCVCLFVCLFVFERWGEQECVYEMKREGGAPTYTYMHTHTHTHTQDTKDLYGQAFGLYALSYYYRASGERRIRSHTHTHTHSHTHTHTHTQDTKDLYGQAFGLYALSYYYRASGDNEALTLAKRLFDLLYTKYIHTHTHTRI
jgi:mannose/cellobiose epimerase-like protein (N-acyl-D-glucosamine 2-epimerase family)